MLLDGLACVIFKVATTAVALAFDDHRWCAVSHAKFNKSCFKELTFDQDTAVIGVLVGTRPEDANIYPSAFLYEVRESSPPWQLYSRYVPVSCLGFELWSVGACLPLFSLLISKDLRLSLDEERRARLGSTRFRPSRSPWRLGPPFFSTRRCCLSAPGRLLSRQ